MGASLDTTSLPPRERYRILREQCERYLQGSCIRVQWAGDLAPARAFCFGGSSSSSSAGGTNPTTARLPHEVDFIFGLSTGHPLNIIRVHDPVEAGSHLS